jgi:hypothetical protein
LIVQGGFTLVLQACICHTLLKWNPLLFSTTIHP